MGLFDRRKRSASSPTPPPPGVAARATCVHSTSELRFGERPEHVEVGLDLLVHGLGGAEHTVHTEATLGWRIAAAICGWSGPDAPDWSDTELAVRVDPDTGMYLCLDADAIRADMAARVAVVDNCWGDAALLQQGMLDLRADREAMQRLPKLPDGVSKGMRSVWNDIREPATPPDDATGGSGGRGGGRDEGPAEDPGTGGTNR
jgi:hypothetical protein